MEKIKRRDKELSEDPELTFKPRINPTKPKKDFSVASSAEPKEEQRKSVWNELHNQAEKYWRMKFDRELDAIEWTKEPEEYTFKPEILGDKRAGKPMPVYSELKNKMAQEMINHQKNRNGIADTESDQTLLTENSIDKF